MSSSPVEFSIPQPKADPFRDRRPPYSEEAEQAVLSAMLLDADAIAPQQAQVRRPMRNLYRLARNPR